LANRRASFAGCRSWVPSPRTRGEGQGEGLSELVAYFFSACHSARVAPVGSVKIENEPTFGMSVTSRTIVAPSDFALSVAALTSSTET